MRWPAAAAILSLWTVPANADCRNDALAALQRSATSGPFRFEAESKHTYPGIGTIRTTGTVIPPDRAYTKTEGDIGIEEIHIGHRKWGRTQRDTDWRVSEMGDQSANIASDLVPSQDRIGNVTCLGEVSEDGRPHIAYEYEFHTDVHPRWGRKLSKTWKLFVDQATRQPVKLLSRAEVDPIHVAESIETRFYDAGLKVEPPDRKGGWESRVQHFRAAVSQADTECRREALTALLRIFAFGPVSVGFLSARGQLLDRMVLVPPNAMHLYRDGTEQIIVDGQAWLRLWRSEWRGSPDNSNALPDMLDAVLPDATFIGDVQCLGEVSEDGRSYRTYEYEKTFTYPDAPGKKIAAFRKMLVDGVTGLPHKFEVRDTRGTLQRTEIWVFDSSLRIEAPKLGGGSAQ